MEEESTKEKDGEFSAHYKKETPYKEKKNPNVCLDKSREHVLKEKNTYGAGARCTFEQTFEGADLMWGHQSFNSAGPQQQVKVICSLLMGLFTLDPLAFHNSSFTPQTEKITGKYVLNGKWKLFLGENSSFEQLIDRQSLFNKSKQKSTPCLLLWIRCDIYTMMMMQGSFSLRRRQRQ